MVRLTGRSGQGPGALGVQGGTGHPCRSPDHPRAKETDMRTLTTWLKAVDSYTLWAFNADPVRRSR